MPVSRSRILLALTLAAALSGAACKKDEPRSTRWEDASAAIASAAASGTPIASSGPVAEGSTLNKRFPADGTGGYTRVFTQEKDGFAEAKLHKDGKEVATLSIADTNANPEAKAKFATAKDKVAGVHPLMTVGKNQSTALVADRWQVKVSSQTLDADARKSILETFDLQGLAK